MILKGEFIMIKKKLAVAGMTAALAAAMGITALANPAGRQSERNTTAQVREVADSQAPSDSQKPDDGQAPTDSQKPENGQKPADGEKPSDETKGEAKEQPGRKSDEEAMKEGNPTPELPEGVTADS